jgi:hypothetical protein
MVLPAVAQRPTPPPPQPPPATGVIAGVMAPAGMSVQGLTVSAMPLINDGPNGPEKEGVVAADGTFEFQTWPRRSLVRVSNVVKIPGGSRGLELRPLPVVRFNDADVTRTGIDIQPGRDIRGLEIELGR